MYFAFPYACIYSITLCATLTHKPDIIMCGFTSEVQIMAVVTAVTLVFVFCPSKHSAPVHFTPARQQKLNILPKDLIGMRKQHCGNYKNGSPLRKLEIFLLTHRLVECQDKFLCLQNYTGHLIKKFHTASQASRCHKTSMTIFCIIIYTNF